MGRVMGMINKYFMVAIISDTPWSKSQMIFAVLDVWFGF